MPTGKDEGGLHVDVVDVRAFFAVDFDVNEHLVHEGGGFFVFNRRIFDYLTPDCILEREPLEALARERELIAYPHQGFWKCMDTYKDNLEFNQLWETGEADWKLWP